MSAPVRTPDDRKVRPQEWDLAVLAVLDRIEAVDPQYHWLFISDDAAPNRTPSDTDAALAVLSWRYAGRDATPEFVEKLMRESLRAREKWDRHRTYMKRTIAWARKVVDGAGSWVTEEQVAARLAAKRAAAAASDKVRWQVMTTADVRALPDPEWLVEDVLPVGVFSEFYGPMGALKSFAALDLANAVAAGRKWLGQYGVKQGRVLYLYAEGGSWIKYRVNALRADRGEPGDAMHYVSGRVDLTDPKDVDAFIERVLATGYVLLVVDTVARNMGAARENEELNAVVDACDTIAERTGTTTLLIHHSGWQGEHSRGPSALPFATDAVWKFERRTDGTAKMTCDRLKDRDPKPIVLQPRLVENSLVLDAVEDTGASATGGRRSVGNRNREAVLTALVSKRDEWRSVAQIADDTNLSRNTVVGHLDALIAGEKATRRAGANGDEFTVGPRAC